MLMREYLESIRHHFFKDGKEIPLSVCCLGLAGEAGELMEEAGNLSRAMMRARSLSDLARHKKALTLEAGDVLWYTAAVCHLLDLDLTTVDGFMPPDEEAILVYVGRVCDAVKKHEWRGKELNKLEILRDLSSLLANVRATLATIQISLEDAASANVEKLSKRYPQGFVEGGGRRDAN